MKITIINGSPRVNGATGQILLKIKEILKEIDANVEINYVDLAKMNMVFCKGCTSCYNTGFCPIKDDGIEELSQQLNNCDGVIFGSPIYATNVSGNFKVLIDRGHFVFEQLLHNKSCFSVVTYENYGGGAAKKVINELIRFSGGAVSCEYVLKLNHNDTVLNDSRNAKIKKLCLKYLAKTRQKNPLSFFERVLRHIVFHVGIKRHVLKNKSRYRAVINRWVNLGLVAERV